MLKWIYAGLRAIMVNVVMKLMMLLVLLNLVNDRVYAIAIDDIDTEQNIGIAKYAEYSATLDEMMGRRLYVYGIVDNIEEIVNEDAEVELVFNINETVTAKEAIHLLYNTIKNNIHLLDESELGDGDTQSEENDNETQRLNKLYNLGIIENTDRDELKYGSKITIHQFISMILRYLDAYTNSEEVIQKGIELELIANGKYTPESILTYGEVYEIISKLIDTDFSKIEGWTSEENLEEKSVILNRDEFKSEIIRPNTIEIHVKSYEDGIAKMEKALSYAPVNILVYFETGCSKEDIETFYNKHIFGYYLWLNNIYGDYMYKDYVDSMFHVPLRPYYDGKYTEGILNVKGPDGDYARELVKGISAKVDAGELTRDEANYRICMEIFKLTSNYDSVRFRSFNYNDGTLIELDRLDWITCVDQMRSKVWYRGNGVEDYDYINDIDDKANAIIKKYIDPLKRLTDYEKLKVVQDIILDNSMYDYIGLQNMRVGQPAGAIHSAFGYIENGLIVCDGYAKAYQWLLNYLDIECVVQYGYTGVNRTSHAWNKVKLDGKWYNVDICWADTMLDRTKYFLKSDEYFNENDHWLKDSSFGSESMKALENYEA